MKFVIQLEVEAESVADAIEKRLQGETVDVYPIPEDVWGDDKTHSRNDWALEVTENNTSLGYWQWVDHCREEDEWDKEQGLEESTPEAGSDDS